MTSALIIGSSVGAVIGLFHAWFVYATLTNEVAEKLVKHPVAVRARGAYFALWTFFLWVLLGAYVFSLWLISVAIYAIHNALKNFRI